VPDEAYNLALPRAMFTLLFTSCLLLPLPLLAIAWSRPNRLPIEFSVLTVSVGLLLSASIHNLRVILLGDDYSHRLFSTIGINVLVVFVLAVLLGLRRRWIGTVAALLVGAGWVLVAAINSAV